MGGTRWHRLVPAGLAASPRGRSMPAGEVGASVCFWCSFSLKNTLNFASSQLVPSRTSCFWQPGSAQRPGGTLMDNRERTGAGSQSAPSVFQSPSPAGGGVGWPAGWPQVGVGLGWGWKLAVDPCWTRGCVVWVMLGLGAGMGGLWLSRCLGLWLPRHLRGLEKCCQPLLGQQRALLAAREHSRLRAGGSCLPHSQTP